VPYKGKDIGDFEYGRIPYAGDYLGDFEFGRIPAIGYGYRSDFVPPEGAEVINLIIPRNRYNKTDYPNLEDRADGMVIPDIYGEVHNITPVCIDTSALTYKIANREITSIDEVVADDVVLVEDEDYTVDLVNAEFTLASTPVLSSGNTYYFSLECDYTIDGSNYLKMLHDPTGSYADGQLYEIDGSDVWTAKSGADLWFAIWGVPEPGEREVKLIESPWTSWSWYSFRDTAARSRLGQSFKINRSGTYYVTKIRLRFVRSGSPTGYLKVRFFDSISPENTVGALSNPLGDDTLPNLSNNAEYDATWRVLGSPSKLKVKAKGYKDSGGTQITKIDKALEDILKNIIGVPDSYIDSAALSALGAARTAEISEYLNSEWQFGELLEKLEASYMFKAIPDLSNKMTFVYFASGEPSGTPHLRAEDISDVEFEFLPEAVKGHIKVDYFRNPTDGTYQTVERYNYEAKLLYNTEDTLALQTSLRSQASANSLAEDYEDVSDDALLIMRFSTKYPLFDRYPTQKVKISYPHAPYTNGELDGVLFRIKKITKVASTGDFSVEAVLDSQTY